MVAKDYPFYLTVKRVNLTLEVKSATTKSIEEPSTKRVKPLSRVTSLANLIPPVRATPLKRFSQSLQRSISFRGDSRPDLFTPRPWSRNAPPPITKRRDSKLWSETFDVCVNQVLTSKEIKRQEAIFELSQGEEDLIEDLKLAKKAYHDPMLKLSIMTEEELMQIFGTLDSLIPLHEDLLRRLRDVRKPDGSTEHVGHILVGWVRCDSFFSWEYDLMSCPFSGDLPALLFNLPVTEEATVEVEGCRNPILSSRIKAACQRMHEFRQEWRSP